MLLLFSCVLNKTCYYLRRKIRCWNCESLLQRGAEAKDEICNIPLVCDPWGIKFLASIETSVAPGLTFVSRTRQPRLLPWYIHDLRFDILLPETHEIITFSIFYARQGFTMAVFINCSANSYSAVVILYSIERKYDYGNDYKLRQPKQTLRKRENIDLVCCSSWRT